MIKSGDLYRKIHYDMRSDNLMLILCNNTNYKTSILIFDEQIQYNVIDMFDLEFSYKKLK